MKTITIFAACCAVSLSVWLFSWGSQSIYISNEKSTQTSNNSATASNPPSSGTSVAPRISGHNGVAINKIKRTSDNDPDESSRELTPLLTKSPQHEAQPQNIDESESNIDPESSSELLTSNSDEAQDEDTKKILLAAGWPLDATTSFCDANSQWLSEHPADARQIIPSISRLAKFLESEDFELIEETPAIVPWLDACSDPERFCKIVRVSKQQGHESHLLNILFLQEDLKSADDIAVLWEKFGDRIGLAWENNIPGTESIFMSVAKPEDDSEFSFWVENELLPNSLFRALPESREELISRIVVGITEGPKIRHRLSSTSPENLLFREHFRSAWASLSHICEGSPRRLESLATHPSVWKVLERTEGETMLRCGGIAAAELLVGDSALPVDLHPRAIRLITTRRRAVVTTFANKSIRVSPYFHRVLRKDVPDELLLRVFDRLLENPDTQNENLREAANDTAQQLREHYQKPVDLDLWDDNLPALLKVPKRKLNNQPLDEGDGVRVGIEVVKLAVAVFAPFLAEGAADATGVVLDVADGGLSESVKNAVKKYDDSSTRIREVISREQVTEMLTDARTPQSLGNTMRLAEELSVRSADASRELLPSFLQIMYRPFPVWNAMFHRLEYEKKILWFDENGRAWISLEAESQKLPFNTTQVPWSNMASQTFMERLCRSKEIKASSGE